MSPERKRNRLAAFFSGEYSRMVAFVRERIDDAAERDGEDIVQDVMERLVHAADFTLPVEDLAAYAYRALRNRIVDALRARRDTVSLDAPYAGDEGATLKDVLRDARYDTAAGIERREIADAVFAAIDSLPEAQRAVIIATEFEGRSFRDVSLEWDTPVGTLLARKSRAVQKVREILSGLAIEKEDLHEN